MNITFIGAGKMATAIARGVVGRNVHTVDEICAVDVVAEARSAFTQQTGAGAHTYEQVSISDADVIVLAVKPQQVENAVSRLPGLQANQLVLSIAAGLSLEKLTGYLHTRRIVRVMPNTPMSIGHGSIAFSTGADVTTADTAWVKRFFESVGLVREVPESLMDTVTAVSGSGPAYVFEFIRGLSEAGIAEGLPAALSREIVAQTVLGAAEMVRQGEGTAAELRDNVTSKGGTTAAGLQVLREAHLVEILHKAVAAAKQRSEELGRES